MPNRRDNIHTRTRGTFGCWRLADRRCWRPARWECSDWQGTPMLDSGDIGERSRQTCVFSDSVSNERETLLSWQSQKNHVLQTWRRVYQDSCLSQLSHRVVEHGLALITSSPSCRDGVQPRSEARLCLEPT